MRKRKFT